VSTSTCHNRACLRLDHLQMVTDREHAQLHGDAPWRHKPRRRPGESAREYHERVRGHELERQRAQAAGGTA
jgi:hypothetical protein